MTIQHVCELSPFFRETLEQNPNLFPGLQKKTGAHAEGTADLPHEDQFRDSLNDDQLNDRYRHFVESDPADDLATTLRLLRKREMARIIYRDLSRIADLVETTRELSCLADFCIATALEHCHKEAVERYGKPVSAAGQPVKMVVIAMGKLGARELNLSSDIDLVFFYSESGELQQESKSITHQEFFLRVARRLIALLDETTASGHVFRVDMRLRPYGDSGPLVVHRAAMEKYYLEQGRDWERYAFIKARISAGDFAVGDDFLNWLKPFIYRRHLDYGAVQSLREMKAMINRQVEVKDLGNNLKLGTGGIREVEFIAQALQLIWGGRYLDLQQIRLLESLKLLGESGFLSTDEVEGLTNAYIFLRNSEHVLQAEFDRQTHQLPDEDVSQQRLAVAMGFEHYDEYLTTLAVHRKCVGQAFTQLMDANSARGGLAAPIENDWIACWRAPAAEQLRRQGLDDDGTLCRELLQLHTEIANLPPETLELVDELLPILLKLASQSADNHAEAVTAALKLIQVVRAVLRRSTYLSFLLENLDALRRALALCAISSWVAEQLERFPILLYELTDRSIHEVAVTKMAFDGELRALLRSLTQGDLEAQMDTLRQYKLAATVKIAALQLLNEKSIMEASDALTALAEVMLEASLKLAAAYLENKHGVPCDEAGNAVREKFAIIAYGKAGGLELAYGSDLDLVFLCPSDATGETDGGSPVNNNVFYTRLAQRVVHILTSFTRFGILYNVDLRLRPQGNKGPLVARIKAFEKYLQDDAWTWEKQALVRARFVAGDVLLGAEFDRIRTEVLTTARELDSLRGEVIEMREKMRQHLSGEPAKKESQSARTEAEVHRAEGIAVLSEFDLKHDSGAIVDIEFMVQYAVLAWAAQHRQLARWRDVMRILDELGQLNLMTEEEIDILQRSYIAFRAAVHYQWLGLAIDFEQLQHLRQEVFKIWEARMFTPHTPIDESTL